MNTPHILLVNPWIHDFAAYDFWAKPLGLLSLAAWLRAQGYALTYLDCLDRFHPRAPRHDPHARFGRGPYRKRALPRPHGLSDVPRRFSRYGIEPAWLMEDLRGAPRPDLILVTGLMTYWYPGVQETIRYLRRAFPRVPVVLGGIYASLCPDHARMSSGADQVVTGGELASILQTVAELTGYRPVRGCFSEDPDDAPFPALDLQNVVNYVPLLTTFGCPCRCAYCASHLLQPRPGRRRPSAVIEELRHWQRRFNVIDFVFYDDALLLNADKHALPLLERMATSGLRLRLHTPNALHIRAIDSEIARLMAAAGFETIRLGLETASFGEQRTLDDKVTARELARSVAALRQAGFRPEQIGAYLLIGLPQQLPEKVAASIRTVKAYGITPILAYYSPIPGTALWPQAVASSRYDLAADPVFTNNAVLPCSREPFSWKRVSRFKQLIAAG